MECVLALGPMLFTSYMLPLILLGNTKQNHCYHCYADDTQLYLSIKPDKTNYITKLQACLKNIKTLKSDKSEVMLSSKNLKTHYLMI